jgi:hypothetical protein
MMAASSAARAQYAPALECYEAALDETLLADDEAFLLCRGAPSSAPVDCFLRGEDELALDDTDVLALCRCTTSTDPIDCALYGDDETDLDTSQILATCSARIVMRLYDDCLPRQ